MSDATIVIVEDNFLIAEDLRAICEDFGASVLGMAHSPETAVTEITAHKPRYVLMDVRLGGKRDGVDVANWVYELFPETRVIFITGSNEPPTIERIRKDHAYRILIKPISPAALREAIGS